jgi:hypothetical protein
VTDSGESAREHVTADGRPKKGWAIKKHAAIIARTMQDEGKHVDVYLCTTCSEYHVGRPRKPNNPQADRQIVQQAADAWEAAYAGAITDGVSIEAAVKAANVAHDFVLTGATSGADDRGDA